MQKEWYNFTVHLHEEGRKGSEKDAEYREASELVGVCSMKKTSDMVIEDGQSAL